MALQTDIIDKEIAKCVQQLNVRQKKVVLNVVKTIANKQTDWWAELSTEQKTAIKEAEAELDAGLGIPHEEVIKKYSKWI